jgi:predicted ATPase
MIYISSIRNRRPKDKRIGYPYQIPSILHLEELTLNKQVTFIIGENGTGKSTLMEAMAINAGFNPEGGSRHFRFSTQDSHSTLFEDILLVRTTNRNKDGFFLRAESFYNVATSNDAYAGQELYQGSLHERSHGESFMAVINQRLFGHGLYIFDEPESALSIVSQLAMLTRIRQLVEQSSQFIIATHSPILMAYPDAAIYEVSADGLQSVSYEETEQYKLTKYFLNHHPKVLSELGLI